MSEAPGTQMSRTNMPQSTAVPLSSAVTAKTDSQVESRNPTSSSRSSNQQIPDSQVNEETSRTIQGDSRRDESGDDDSLGNLRPIKLKSGLERKPKLAEFACTPYEVRHSLIVNQYCFADYRAHVYYRSSRTFKRSCGMSSRKRSGDQTGIRN